MIGEGRCAKTRQLLRFLGTSAPLPHLVPVRRPPSCLRLHLDIIAVQDIAGPDSSHHGPSVRRVPALHNQLRTGLFHLTAAGQGYAWLQDSGQHDLLGTQVMDNKGTSRT